MDQVVDQPFEKNTGTKREMEGKDIGVSLRIQICPKKGISLIILLYPIMGMGCFDHQCYSREGSGFLGFLFFG